MAATLNGCNCYSFASLCKNLIFCNKFQIVCHVLVPAVLYQVPTVANTQVYIHNVLTHGRHGYFIGGGKILVSENTRPCHPEYV